MSTIAGLQDFRQTGPPADTGTFQLTTDILVFQHVFAGTTYICAMRRGDRGWVLIDYLPTTAANNATVIQAALNGLTAGRTWKETVTIIGNYSIGAVLTLPSYIILDLSKARLTLANGVNDDILRVSNDDYIEVRGGFLDQNGANQTAGSCIYFTDIEHFIIDDVDARNGYEINIRLDGDSYDGIICNCYCYGSLNDDNIAVTYGAKRIIIENNTSENGADKNIEVDSNTEHILILGNTSRFGVGGGIHVHNLHGDSTYTRNIVIANNQSIDDQVFGIGVTGRDASRCEHILIDGNYVEGTVVVNGSGSGIDATYVDNLTISNNNIRDVGYMGIEVKRVDYFNVSDNNVDDPAGNGMELLTASYGVISGNNLRDCGGWAGIVFESTVTYCTITGNNISGSTQGIRSYNSTYNFIAGNTIRTTTGIYEGGTSDYNMIGKNDLRGCTTPATIIGEHDVLLSRAFQFVKEVGTATWLTTSPTGIEIDAADEGAIAHGWAPHEAQMVIRFRIAGVGLAAPGAGNQMRLEININAGKPAGHEAYNAEAIAVANKNNTETGFAINDAVEWVITATDDPDVDDIETGETFECIVMHEVAGDSDIATDVAVRTVTVEYV